LEWLDIPATVGQTYNAIAGGYGGYTTTYGFRFASVAEFNTLIANLGLVQGYNLPSGQSGAVLDLLNHLGYVNYFYHPSFNGFIHAQHGYLATTDFSSGIRYAYMSSVLESDFTDIQTGIFGGMHPDTASGNVGAMLVRTFDVVTTVPEPSTILLLGTGGVLAYQVWRRGRRAT